MTHNAESFSNINDYGRCAYRHYLKKVVRIQRKRKNVNLYQGTSTHEGMKEFFLAIRAGDDFEDAEARMNLYYDETLENLWEDNPMLFKDEVAELAELVEDSRTIVTRYLEKERDFIMTWEILHVEEEFIFILDNEVVTFTPDLVIRDKNGFVWIVDHKTTSKMPSNELPFSDLQTLLYFAGVKELYPEVRGFVFNYLRKKVPTVPRLNSTHTKESKQYGYHFVNNVKNIDTTYEMLRDFILEEAPHLMGEPTHQQKLAELRDNDRFFWTETIVVSDTQVEQILSQVADTLEQMKWSRETGIYPKTILNDLAGVQSCSRCEFARICSTQLLGWNTELVIEEEYEPRDPKNEYEEETDDE